MIAIEIAALPLTHQIHARHWIVRCIYDPTGELTTDEIDAAYDRCRLNDWVTHDNG
jgi:hypothetical protein